MPKEISGFEYLASELFGADQPYDAIEALADYDANMTLQFDNLGGAFKLPLDKLTSSI